VDQKHQITCDPDSQDPTIFTYQTNYNYDLSMPGQLGLWCSSIRLWKEIEKNNYNHTLILEDDVRIKSNDFKDKLNEYINALPASYDIAWFDAYNNKKHIKLENPDDLFFKKQGQFWLGTYAYLISKSGVNKLLSSNNYACPIDVYLAMNSDVNTQCKVSGNDYLLESYVYAGEVLDPYGASSSTISS